MSGGETKEYLDVFADFQLTQHMKDPSQVCDLSVTLIDHVIGSNCFAAVNITQALGISDHRVQAIDFNILISRSPPRQCWIRSFKKFDWEQLMGVLHAVPWNLLDTFNSIDDKWVFFILC